MAFYRRYKKYQWISVSIQKNPKDNRKDSYRPELNTLKPLGAPIDTQDGWTQRKQIILPTLTKSLCQLVNNYSESKVSLGIIKPKNIINLRIEKTDENWSVKHQDVLTQLRLFGPQPKELNKVPFKFSYIFTCNDEHCSKKHSLCIIDWEIFALYFTLKEKYGYSMDVVLKKIREKWFDQMCKEDRDTYLILGSRYPTPTFMVLGVFWPPKTQ